MTTHAVPLNITTADTQPANSAGLRLWSKFVLLCTAFLVFKGALVTSHGAGLAVPDWPATFGENMFLYPPSKWVGGVYYEHVHRLIAAGVGLFTAITAIWVWRVEPRRWVRIVAYAMVLAVILQGTLGGLTVLYGLPAYLSSAHGILGQTFFALTVLLAYTQSKELAERVASRTDARGDRASCIVGVSLLFLLYVQLSLGAFMRHTESGLAIPDFPTMGNSYSFLFDAARLDGINQLRSDLGLASVELYQVWLHLAHRTVGFVVLGAFLAAFLWLNRRREAGIEVRSTARFLWLLTCVQLLLGIFTVLSLRHPVITSLHVVTGAIMIGMTLLLVLRSVPKSAYEGVR